MTTLFEHKVRTDDKHANHLDNTYNFYDRSSSKQVAQLRETLNAWFDNYPKSEKPELKRRFQTSFSSPFFELFLHELFRRQGFTLEPHPILPGTKKRPDFLVRGHGLEFYLEAKESTAKSEIEKSNENRINQLYDQINKSNTPNFFFRINELQLKSTNQPSGKKIVKYIESQLPRFDPDKVAKTLQQKGLENLETITYDDIDVKLVISLIPKSSNAQGKEGLNPIGIYPLVSYWGGADMPIKTSIEKKAARYGEIEKPYLICINSTSEKGDVGYDMMNALFGSLQMTFFANAENRNERLTRAKDGVFLNSQGPKFKRVSAIFITNVHPANLQIANHWLVRHPFANKELLFDPFELTKVVVENQQIKTINGKSIKEILEIPDNWLMTEV
ncbi:MAG TPA: hypothetical protein PLW09_05405 [Candidatus Kapabacteria bacterium]|nr:hypothetical protein [Candidatus Kapabacteria bacterium]